MSGLRTFHLAGLGLGVLLAGCQVGPDFQSPDAKAPDVWRAGPPAATDIKSHVVSDTIDASWWGAFGDPLLNDLEQRAGQSNLSIAASAQRIVQSRAIRAVAGADAVPSLDANASYERQRLSANGQLASIAKGSGRSIRSGDIWQFGFDASWELDLWGRVARNIEASDASLEASLQDHRDVVLAVRAEIARNYVDLRRIQATLALNRELAGTASHILKLVANRSTGGTATGIDVANARSLLERIDADNPRLEQEQEQAINAIDLLLGEQPGTLRPTLIETGPVPPVPSQVPIGLPSDLARRRPDIRRAEAQLHAATAEIGVAEGAFYPRITLSGDASLQAMQFRDLGNWSSRQFGIGPGVSLPIFQGGRLTGNLEFSKAREREAAIAYHAAVLDAWREVDDKLAAYHGEQQRNARLARTVEADRRALSLAHDRFDGGVADFVSVLEARRTMLSSQQALAESQGTLATDLIGLYKALGGGWDDTAVTVPEEKLSQVTGSSGKNP